MRRSLAVFLFGAIAAASPFSALADPVTMAWSPVGNPGNSPDPATGHGAVDYSFNIGTYDVTVSQYVAFLNSNDPTGADPLGLYVSNMSSATYDGGVSYTSGATAGSKYGVVSGDANHPINFPTFYDALRFANWLNNGQTPGSTETGAYTLLGGTPTPSNGNSITRNSDATVFIPNEDEWYKAAYYNPAARSYYSYPTSSNTAPTASGPTSAHNSANYNNVGSYSNGLTNVGAYSGTTSPYGAFDMAGDVWQWNEQLVEGTNRGDRGGAWDTNAFPMASANQSNTFPYGGYDIGFRVASILTPEPSTLVLGFLGIASLFLSARRRKA